ncbi:Protein of unknown function (DUF4197) [Cyclonatronum proteinivorum]|uniref:DUF4197 domain-containing protein n=1 Tax=Cyclonatronum proteinivorum TaxID=1457365 RepID=A0A345UKU8_9BACT|nr:DUF4197 domain-containing protein [Cyclonatronum proteinivorum]AXJ01100.1 Protein of unknown function (DUF4197) [Cyclonatronum proteinivorum]
MNSHLKPIAALLSIFFFLSACAELQQFMDQTGVGGGELPLTETEVVNGLKNALEVGAARAADTASQEGGFTNNQLLFIAFPEEARRVENTLRDLGFGSLVDDFVTTLNRSAEEAARSAAPVFRQAVQQMTIQDGFEILRGADNAATDYFRRTTTEELHNLFRPVISQALDNTLATRYWNDIVQQYNRIPFMQPVQTDLVDYTTVRATEGLFTLLEQEEKAIREDPVKRTTDILRRVFGHSSLQPAS